MNTVSLTRRTPALIHDPRYMPESESPNPMPQRPLEALAFSHYLWLFRRYAWQITLVVLAAAGLAAGFCYWVQPVYEAVTRITIDQRVPSAAMGQAQAAQGASDVDQMITTEMQIIQSDAVLRPVVEQFHLNVPKVGQGKKGSILDSAASSTDSDPGEASVTIPNLTVTHLPNSLLIDIHYRSTDPRQAAAVTNAIAQSYISRSMESRAHSSAAFSEFMEKQIAELKKNMDDSALALAGYEKEMGVISPDEKTSLLTARVLQLNTQYTEAQNDRISKETEYKAIASGTDANPSLSSTGAAIDVSPQAAALSRQEQQLHEAEEKFAIAKTVYGPNYPEYKRAANDVAELTRQNQQMRSDISKRIEVSYREAANREDMLRNSLQATKSESDRLNAHSAQYQELKREAEGNRTLYDELFRKIKEAGINSGIDSSAIRIADMARPPAHPVFPKKALFIAVATIFALLASLLVVLLLDLFDKTLRDPEQAARLTGMDVMGILPNVRSFPETHTPLEYEDGRTLVRSNRRSLEKHATSSEEFYRESIASLLNIMLLSSLPVRLRSILITSASPGDGKSSCASNLAIESARLGKKTLLIDADMRSPSQHHYFGLTNEQGLNGAITDHTPLSELCQRVKGTSMLEVVVAGPSTPHKFRHVGRGVSELLNQAMQEDYDLVVIDAPPMVGLTEPIEIARLTDGVLVIGDANHTNQQSVSAVYAALVRVHANVLGLVLNRFRPEMSESNKQYRSYSIYAGRLTDNAA